MNGEARLHAEDAARAHGAAREKVAAKAPTLDNRRARYEYEILELLEAGVALTRYRDQERA